MWVSGQAGWQPDGSVGPSGCVSMYVSLSIIQTLYVCIYIYTHMQLHVYVCVCVCACMSAWFGMIFIVHVCRCMLVQCRLCPWIKHCGRVYSIAEETDASSFRRTMLLTGLFVSSNLPTVCCA